MSFVLVQLMAASAVISPCTDSAINGAARPDRLAPMDLSTFNGGQVHLRGAMRTELMGMPFTPHHAAATN